MTRRAHGANVNTNTQAHSPVAALNLVANFAGVREELMTEIAAVCESGAYVLGARTEAFEKDLAAYCGARFALGVSSGTDALLAALMAFDIGRGDEVIAPTYTFFATAGVVHRLGARPVFVDIRPDTFNIDTAQVAERITTRTRAIVPVHLYGFMAEMRPLFDVVNRHGIHVIEDAAQAIGATAPDFPGRGAGAIGAFGALSFYPTKNLGAIGDAGALLTNDERLFERSRKIRVHGSGHTYFHEMVGGNFRIDALQAAILRVKLRHLAAWTRRRQDVARRYDELFADSGLAPETVTLPNGDRDRHVFHQYVIRTPRRDELMKRLQERKIGCGVYYPLPLHLQECFAYLGYRRGDFPVAEKAAAEVLALPIYPEITNDDQATVVNAIREFHRGG